MNKINTLIVAFSAAIAMSATDASAGDIGRSSDIIRVIPENKAELLSSTPQELAPRVR